MGRRQSPDSVSSGANTTQFAYDGLNRRARITQLVSNKVTSDKFYFWAGQELLLETDTLKHKCGDLALLRRRRRAERQVPSFYAADKLGRVRWFGRFLGYHPGQL